MKLWDLPLAHIPPNPGRYKTRRSGWMHLDGGRSFCMEAVYTKDEPGAGKPSFCSVDLLQGARVKGLFCTESTPWTSRRQASRPPCFCSIELLLYSAIDSIDRH